MPRLARFRHLVLLAALVACGCGEDDPLLVEVCDDEPPPSYGDPDGTIYEPVQPPYRKITFRWNCVEGFFVSETWEMQDSGCWLQSDTYRSQNLNCP